ncbi:MAG: aminotransferase class V-fold PLP-dependent enzyme, partial [Geminicoccaceae bacterium]
MPLDLDFVRAQFPALGDDWVAFDNAGGSQILGRVVDRISDYLLWSNVQHGASYARSELAAARLREAEGRVAELINADRPQEVVMGSSTTMLLHLLAEALALRFASGDQVVVTNSDHEANIGPWMRLRERGVEVRIWPVDPETLTLEPDALDRLMTPRTRLVCVTHASNILGTLNPIAEIARLVHERGARLCVDAVAYA